MALSLSNFLYHLVLLVATILPAVNGVTHHFDWNVGWVRANPDGQHERPVIGLNGEWPWPLLNFTIGDRVIIDLHNRVSFPHAFHHDILTGPSSGTRARVCTFTVSSKMEAPIWMVRWECLNATYRQARL